MQKLLIIFEIVIIFGSLFSDDFWASFWAGNVVLEIPLLIPYIIFLFIKNKKTQNNKNVEIENEIDKILQKCKQDGSLDDIENLKNLAEQNIKTNGSSIEFLELNFAIAKLYNIRVETENAKEYFSKVKNILSRLSYQDICFLAQKSTDEKDFHDAVFYYTYILLYNKVKDIKEIPEIYYNRAIAYQGLNQVSCKDKAIEDLKTAITKTKEISDSLSYIEVETFLEDKLDRYNFQIAKIYKGWKIYKEAITYYNQVLKNSNMYNDAQIQAKICSTEYEKELNIMGLSYGGYYNYSQQYYLEGEYEKAIEYINYALKYSPKNEELLNFKKKIETEQNSTTQEIQNNNIYNDTVVNNDFNNNTDNKIEFSNIKINLEICSKADLLTIDGFDEEKADRFIKERDNGKTYYDIESFVADYALMPHQMFDIQDRLVCPPKPKNKIGRKIDW